MTEQRPSKEQFSAVKEFEEWNDVTGALPDGTSWNYECLSIMEDADKEIERLRTALRGIQSCSTCERCRGAATLALGGATPEPEPTHFAFLIKRPRDKEAWPTIFADREGAEGYEHRASPVVPVCLTQPPVAHRYMPDVNAPNGEYCRCVCGKTEMECRSAKPPGDVPALSFGQAVTDGQIVAIYAGHEGAEFKLLRHNIHGVLSEVRRPWNLRSTFRPATYDEMRSACPHDWLMGTWCDVCNPRTPGDGQG